MDYLVPAQGMFYNYYKSIKLIIKSQVEDAVRLARLYARLFMPAGLGMCPGFMDPDSFDTQKAIEQWVEQGTAPDTIMGKNKVGEVVHRSRPICAWPRAAIYKGRGDSNNAVNYSGGIRK